MSEPDWPALFRSMQDQLGMLQAEFIQLKDTSVSKASLHDTLQSALIAQSQHLGTVMQTAVQEALGTRVQAEPAQAAEGPSAPPPPSSPRSRTDKDPQLPNYDGNSDATEFFEQCAEIFRARNTSPLAQLNYGILALRGSARVFIREKRPTTFGELKELILGRFRLPNEDFHLATKLRSLQMSGDNLESYLRDFKFVASKLGSSLTDSDKRITFINGLSNQVALEVLRAKPNSFEEAERAALEYYSCRRLTKNHVQFSSGIESEVNVLYRRKSFSASPRRRSFSDSSAGSQSSSASRQPRDRQQRGRSPRPSGQVHSVLPSGRSSRSGNNYGRTSPGRRNAPRAKSPSSSFQRRPWAPKRDFRPRSQSPGRRNGPTRANFGTKSRNPYNKGNRPTSMEVDVLTDLLATARDRRPNG